MVGDSVGPDLRARPRAVGTRHRRRRRAQHRRPRSAASAAPAAKLPLGNVVGAVAHLRRLGTRSGRRRSRASIPTSWSCTTASGKSEARKLPSGQLRDDRATRRSIAGSSANTRPRPTSSPRRRARCSGSTSRARAMPIEPDQGLLVRHYRTIPKLAASRPMVHAVDMNQLCARAARPTPTSAGCRTCGPTARTTPTRGARGRELADADRARREARAPRDLPAPVSVASGRDRAHERDRLGDPAHEDRAERLEADAGRSRPASVAVASEHSTSPGAASSAMRDARFTSRPMMSSPRAAGSPSASRSGPTSAGRRRTPSRTPAADASIVTIAVRRIVEPQQQPVAELLHDARAVGQRRAARAPPGARAA